MPIVAAAGAAGHHLGPAFGQVGIPVTSKQSIGNRDIYTHVYMNIYIYIHIYGPGSLIIISRNLPDYFLMKWKCIIFISLLYNSFEQLCFAEDLQKELLIVGISFCLVYLIVSLGIAVSCNYL